MRKNRKGFTLVELLVVITIVGILTGFGIYNYSRVINKAKGENYETNVSSLKVVSESYLQANKELAPKNIGDTIEIKVSDLKEANYLTEDIYNADGESCMKESYVKVYKSSQTDYVYTPYIYCGKDSVPEEKTPNEPSVEISFSPASEVANPYFTYVIKGDPSDASVKIDGFTYTIYAKLKGESDFQEVYKSGSIGGNRQATVEGKKFLRDHIDITSYSTISVSITAVNELGGTFTKVMSPGETQTYHDDHAPVCLRTLNQSQGFDDWIGKYNDPPSRTITVVCDDGEKTGSGCIRTNFSKTWANDERDASGKQIYKFGAEDSTIIIEDNAKNTTGCPVKVNVDVASPSIDLRVKGNNVVHKQITLGGYNESTMKENAFIATIGANDYSAVNPPKNDGKVWFNSTYKNGITIEVDVKDNFYLDKWEWRVNKEGYPTNTANATITSNVQIKNKDGASGSFNPKKGSLDNERSKNITVGFKEDGMRYGELWIWDKAKNYTKVMIYANLDKVAPDVPKDIATYTLKSNTLTASNDKVYTKAVWTNKYVRAEIDSKYKKDTISGYEKVMYRTFEHRSYEKARETGEGKDGNFVFHDGYQGKNKIDFNMCDFAGNCSDYSKKADIWLDTIDPECRNEISYDGTLSGAEKGNWLGFKNGQGPEKETATVTGICSDKYTEIEKGSGCDPKEHLSYTYKLEINTKVAGPAGNNKGGIYHDVAGNSTTCPVDQTVKIDYTLPTCTVTKTTSAPETSYGWLGIGKTATVIARCTDTKSRVANSGCYTKDFSKLYDFEIDTTKAGAKGALASDPGGNMYDNADNYVTCPKNQSVQIDYTPASCSTVRKANYGSTFSDDDWLGFESDMKTQETATVSPKCTDNNGKQDSSVKSGCDEEANSFSYTYNFEIKTTRAGAKGDGIGGTIYDKAGNPTNCPADQRMQIDYHLPVCTTSKKNYGTEGPENWLEIGEHAVVKAHCTDPNGMSSGCKTADFEHDYNYDINTPSAGANGNNNGGVVYDRADNKTNCPADQLVKVDHTRPKCDVTKATSKPENAKGWLNAVGSYGTATVTATCNEVKEGAKSGCVTPSFSKLYDYEINSTTAGANGNNSGGSVYDLAGNETKCGYQTVKIDYTDPTCSVSQSAPGQNSAKWSQIGETVTVTAKCSDRGGSNCDSDYGTSRSHTYAVQMMTVEGGAISEGNSGMFYDNAGNSVECPANEVFNIDYTNPSCKKTDISKTDWSETGPTVKFECNDKSNSGLKTCMGKKSTKATVSGIKSNYNAYVSDKADNKPKCCTVNVKSKIQKSTCKDHSACIKTTCKTTTKNCTCGKPKDGSCTSYTTSTTGSCSSACGNVGGCGYREDSSYCSAWNYRKDDSCPCTSWSTWSDDNSCTNSGYVRKCRTLYKYDSDNCPGNLPDPEPTETKTTYTLKYNANGCGSSCTNVTKEKGKKWGTLCNSVKSGYTLVGWYTNKTGGEQITNDSVAEKNLTVYAHCEQIPKCELKASGTKGSNDWYKGDVTVSFKSKVGSSYGISTSSTADYNSKDKLKLTDSTKETTVYGYVKSGSSTAKCSIKIKIDKDDPEYDYKCIKINNKDSFKVSFFNGEKTYTDEHAEKSYNRLTEEGDTYGLIVAYRDKTSKVYSRTYQGGDAVQGWVGSYSTREETDGISWDVPGAGAPLKFRVKNICDMAGNCILSKAKEHVCPEDGSSDDNPSCKLKVNSGTKGNNGWYTSDVTVGFDSKSGSSFGLSTSKSASYNSKKTLKLTSSGTVYGYVKNGSKTDKCSISLKIDKDKPMFDYKCVKEESYKDLNVTLNFGGVSRSYDNARATFEAHHTGQNAKYAIVMGFYDKTSPVYSLEQKLGDIERGYVSDFTGTTNHNNLWSVPGASAPLKVAVRNICDEAGNCIYTSTGGNEIKCPYKTESKCAKKSIAIIIDKSSSVGKKQASAFESEAKYLAERAGVIASNIVTYATDNGKHTYTKGLCKYDADYYFYFGDFEWGDGGTTDEAAHECSAGKTLFCRGAGSNFDDEHMWEICSYEIEDFDENKCD